jgi:hypothetical protein
MFGPAWTGQEPSVELPPQRLGPLKAKFANDTLRAQAEAAKERARQKYEADLPLYDRAKKVQVTIAARAAAGEIRTKLRPTAGGQLTDIPAHHWNTEKLTPRFAWCQMSMAQPFSDGMGGQGYGHIYVDRASLERFLGSQPFASKPADLDIHMSPYVKLMLHVIRKWEITPDNQYTKDALEAAMKEEWTGPIELSDRLAKAMATLVREPESQAGRASKQLDAPKGVTQKKV